MFVHGGWADSSGWNAEIAHLPRRGYPVIAPANPLRGLSSDAAYVRSVLATIPGDVVLVGHSYGGAVITNAAVGAPNVKALVYIAAFAPDTGETRHLGDDEPRHPDHPRRADRASLPAPGETRASTYTSRPTGSTTRLPATCRGAPPDLMQATQRPFSLAAFTEPSGTPAWKTIPSWYLVATDDHAIPPATQQFMASRAGSTVAQVKASHVPMMSRPAQTTALILEAARAVS